MASSRNPAVWAAAGVVAGILGVWLADLLGVGDSALTEYVIAAIGMGAGFFVVAWYRARSRG